MELDPKVEQLRKTLHGYLADYNENFNPGPDESRQTDEVKIKVAVGFAAVCAVLLLCVFIFLLYKVLWFRFRNGSREKSDAHQLQPQNPTIRGSDFTPSRQQRRHRPLMKSDSSSSEVHFGLSDRFRRSTSPSSDSENGAESSLHLGKLEFSIGYDTDKEHLHVALLSARDLPFDKATSYVELYFLPEKTEKRQTAVHYSDVNPVFEERFEFPVAYSELCERTLQFCVFHIDKFSRHHTLGEVLYSFDVNDNVEEDKAVTICKEIQRDLSLSTSDNGVRGGEVLVSLCYLPTTGRLTLVVLKARLSKVKLAKELPNPYVKVSLMLGGRQIKKTKTSIQKQTLHPVYNEAFVFDIPIHRLNDVSLVIRALKSHDDDGTTTDDAGRLIGKAIVGPGAGTSIGLHHWNCMMTTPRKPVAQWHPLLG